MCFLEWRVDYEMQTIFFGYHYFLLAWCKVWREANIFNFFVILTHSSSSSVLVALQSVVGDILKIKMENVTI